MNISFINSYTYFIFSSFKFWCIKRTFFIEISTQRFQVPRNDCLKSFNYHPRVKRSFHSNEPSCQRKLSSYIQKNRRYHSLRTVRRLISSFASSRFKRDPLASPTYTSMKDVPQCSRRSRRRRARRKVSFEYPAKCTVIYIYIIHTLRLCIYIFRGSQYKSVASLSDIGERL